MSPRPQHGGSRAAAWFVVTALGLCAVAVSVAQEAEQPSSPAAPPVALTPPSPTPPSPTHQASKDMAPLDRGALESIFEEHGIVAEPSKPSVTQYLQDLGKAVGSTITEWIESRFGALSGTASTLIGYVASALLAGLVLVVLIVWGRLLWQRRTQSTSQDASLKRRAAAIDPDEADGKVWEERLRQALQSKDIAAAIEALWWWLAEALRLPAEASWTSRELVQRAGRRDLLPFVRRLDRLIYGAVTPRVGDVETLWQELGQGLADGDRGDVRRHDGDARGNDNPDGDTLASAKADR